MTPSPQNPRRNLIAAIAALFVLGFFIHLILLARATSLTWDEADHTYAGYMSWRHADFGINPQHPPLVKYLATLPLLSMHLEEPTRQDRPYRLEEVLNGRNLLFRNDADTISFRSRIAASLLTVLLVILMFLFTQEMFFSTAGLLALALVTFDPTLLAHGAVVTTDPTGDGGVLPGFGDQREVELLVQSDGFTPVEAIKIATLNGATYLGRQDTIGSIAPGKNADLVIIKGNPAANINDIENVELVFKDGIAYDSAKLFDSIKGRYGQY